MTQVQVFGVRHHGPGSARSLRAALDAFAPDCVLVEGPSDAQGALAYVTDSEMAPPVALLAYAHDSPRRAVYYPFAVFSPEWQALDWALRRGVAVRFADLGVGASMALEDASPDDELAEPASPHDPLAALARAAGYDDVERWWEQLVEGRRGAHDGGDAGIFAAVLEAMQAAREAGDGPMSLRERAREACMRTELRAAVKKGYERVAFVCGAWHAPALAVDIGPEGRCARAAQAAKADKALLATLPRPIKIECTWIPWTDERLAAGSGYAAGVDSPGWYGHLWEATAEGPDTLRVSEGWLVRVARLLREEGLETSSAQLIDAVRLADALAAMRGRALPGLDEMNEAACAVLCMGQALPMQLIEQRLTVGNGLGCVPSGVPKTPLQRDFEATLKGLRLKRSAELEHKRLDLREAAYVTKANGLRTSSRDLQISALLHRLLLLGVPWGRLRDRSLDVAGTWAEGWSLQWRPELEVSLIVMGRHGATIFDAASSVVREQADEAPDLRTLVALLKSCRPADLPRASAHVARRLQDEAATAIDVGALMDALVEMVPLVYGDVRNTDAGVLRTQIESMLLHVLAVHGLHGLVAGRVARILLEAQVESAAAVETRMALALSPASEPASAAAWVEGFLRDSGALLIYDDRLWRVIDDWLAGLQASSFMSVLPLLRRTFSTFSTAERRAMGELARRGATAKSQRAADALDGAAVAHVLPILGKVLGVAS
ncbi:MAG: hypothetical protein EB084_10425 [Proteobacteria bacterium]|nr:hypothetical protein [Pseudomonadota bacterium]